MKKLFKLFLPLIIIFSLASCKSANAIDNDPEDEVKGDSNILVAYFSFSGNTQSVAKMISDELEADLFRIVVETPYTNDDVFNRAQDELNSKTYPSLSSHIDKEVFASYDTIILGFPIWWYDIPMPVWSFIKEYDFKDKTVIPFFTHNGSSSGANSLTTLTELLQDSNLKSNQVLSIRGSNANNSSGDVKAWLVKIGLKH